MRDLSRPPSFGGKFGVWPLGLGQALELSDRLEGGGEGRGVRMDRKATTSAKNDDIVEKLLRFINFPEDKVGMMVEMG